MPLEPAQREVILRDWDQFVGVGIGATVPPRSELPEKWHHFYAHLEPALFQASAEVVASIGEAAVQSRAMKEKAERPAPPMMVESQPRGGRDHRWRAVQQRVRELALSRVGFANALRQAFQDFLKLHFEWVEGNRDLAERERALGRNLLARGFLIDPGLTENQECLFVEVEGLCPMALAERLRVHDPPTGELERESAATALAAMDLTLAYESANPKKRKKMAAAYQAAKDSGTHTEIRWRVEVARPSDWEHPANPHSLERDRGGCFTELERFSQRDYLTIALYRLGGLADHGAPRKIVPKPKGDTTNALVARRYWEVRLCEPTEPPGDAEFVGALARTGVFTADLAEQMLAMVERCLASHKRTVKVSPKTQRARNKRGDDDGSRQRGRPAPQLNNPVLIAQAAHVAGLRPDVLKRTLQRMNYPIGGTRGRYQVELAQAISALPPEKRRQVKKWAAERGFVE